MTELQFAIECGVEITYTTMKDGNTLATWNNGMNNEVIVNEVELVIGDTKVTDFSKEANKVVQELNSEMKYEWLHYSLRFQDLEEAEAYALTMPKSWKGNVYSYKVWGEEKARYHQVEFVAIVGADNILKDNAKRKLQHMINYMKNRNEGN